MAAVDDSLSRYVQALLTQIEWGSPLLASASGTAAWVHGSDAAWWLGASMQKYPEQFPLEVAAQARQYYEIGAPQALSVQTKPEKPATDVGRCVQYCRSRYWLTCNPVTAVTPLTKCECEKQCEASGGAETQVGPFGVARGRPGESGAEAIARQLAPWAIGVGLVLLGAWALVR
jgi:hypothetical protein